MSLTVYVGPFIKAKRMMIDVKENNFGCHKCSSVTFTKAKFCSECGVPLGVYEVSKKVEKVNPFELTEKVDEMLAHAHVDDDSHQYYTPNVPYSLKRECRFPADGEPIVIEPSDIENEIQIFKGDYKNAIAKCVEAYGSVEVKWGILTVAD